MILKKATAPPAGAPEGTATPFCLYLYGCAGTRAGCRSSKEIQMKTFLEDRIAESLATGAIHSSFIFLLSALPWRSLQIC
jgi:hypothetical protein